MSAAIKIYLVECEYCEVDSHITSQYEPQYCPSCSNEINAEYIKDVDEED